MKTNMTHQVQCMMMVMGVHANYRYNKKTLETKGTSATTLRTRYPNIRNIREFKNLASIISIIILRAPLKKKEICDF